MRPLRSLGIFGGSFNPVHSGHILLARHARAALKLDELWFVPCSQSADGKSLAPARLRLSWLNKALKAEEGLKACAIEVKRGGISRTIDTLRELRRTLGGKVRFILLMGQDQALRLPAWKEATCIVAMARVAVFHRAGAAAGLPNGFKARPLRAPLFDISSSEIRARIQRRENVSLLLPPVLARDATLLRYYRAPRAAGPGRLALGRGKGYHAVPH